MPAHPRQFQFLLAYLLAFVLASGAGLPSPWAWQCRHASQIVSGPPIVAGPEAGSSASMPCRGRARAAMASMPCCRAAGIQAAHSAFHRAAISEPACRPTLTRLAALPAAQTPQKPNFPPLAAACAAGTLRTSPALPGPLPTPQLRRPPPSFALPASPSRCLLAPRAPPVA